VLILPFTRRSRTFRRRISCGNCWWIASRVRAVLVGDNFCFGYRQSGNTSPAGGTGRAPGVRNRDRAGGEMARRMVSSSGIRALLKSGRVSLAARMLQHPYALDGAVVEGRGVGSKQTVPTLNLAPDGGMIPAAGVYVTRAYDLAGARQWNAITNIGYRPTFGASDQLSIETFLLDPFTGDTPGRIRLEFLWRVRDERQFESPAALKEQILRDVGVAQRYFRRTRAWIGA
jgi:riboflavin kinase / FMN adenylyltransferase